MYKNIKAMISQGTIWPQKVYDMIWLWYDMWMTDIYMLSYDMKYVMVWNMW